MSQSPTHNVIGPQGEGYVDAWRQVNRLLREGHSFSGREKNCLFLNVHGGRFADAAAVSGFDLDDDGRGLALSDWDLDGDLDLWLTNRTGPRLRFLENQFSQTPNFVGLLLQATAKDCNRDAVGARVELQLDDSPATTLVRTVRSGDGYLSQSSRRLLFGLGTSTAVRRLTVRWPNGDVEHFSPPETNAHYRLVQGRGRCERISLAKSDFKPAPDIKPNPGAPLHLPTASLMQTANLLTARLPLPSLTYQPFEGPSADAAQPHPAKPRLVNLWSTSCQPCLQELREWCERRDELESVAQILLLAVDGIEAHSSVTPSDVQRQLARMNVAFEGGMATSQLFRKIQIIHDQVYDHSRPLPVPTSLLIDRDGRLAAIYKGKVSVDRILSDCQRLTLKDEELLAEALPSPGLWIATPGPHRVEQIIDDLFAAGWRDDALAFAARLDEPLGTHRHEAQALVRIAVDATRQGAVAEAIEQLNKALELDPGSARAHMELGTIYGRRNNLPLAIEHLQQAVQLDGDRMPDAHLNLGIALRRAGQGARAVTVLSRALEIDPSLTPAHVNLGLARGQMGDLPGAVESFQAALRIDPDQVQTRINLAVALIQLQRPHDALGELQQTLEQQPDLPIALSYTSELLSKLGRITECVKLLEDAVARRPRVAPLRLQLAGYLEQAGEAEKALSHYREAERLDRGNLQALSRIAWILSTDPDSQLRDGPEALKVARRANANSQGRNVAVLDVLAAAYAETGDFDQAVEAAELAQQIALEHNQTRDAQAVARRLMLYRQRQPYRTPQRSFRAPQQ